MLSRAGVEAAAVTGFPQAGRSAPDGEDVVIIPFTGDVSDIAAFVRAARSDGRSPLAVLAGLKSDAPPPLGLDQDAVFAGAVALDAPSAVLAAQVAAFQRAGVAEEERNRRELTAKDLDLPAPAAAEQRMLKAVYIGAPSPLFLQLETILGKHGGLVAAAFSSFAGFDHLHDESFDAVVLNGAQDPLTAVSLCAALRRNASLYHLPTMVITAAGDEKTRKSAIERGATAVVDINAPSSASVGWLFEAIRRERRRQAAEHDLRAYRDMMGDARTGLFRPTTFEAHLGRLAADHHATGRTLSLAALRALPAHGAERPSDEIWTRGFTEISSLAARLIRDADCGSAFGAEFIIAALPATDHRGARRTAERIASVAECTAFASGETGAVPVVFEQSAVEMQPGESGSALLARALRAFDDSALSA